MLLKLYLFLSLAVLEGSAFFALLVWFWNRFQHPIVIATSVFLAPAWAILLYREWKTF